MRRLLFGLLLAIVTILAVPAVSSAGVYTDFECLAPTGAPAPSRGFTADANQGAFTANTCGAVGGALNLGLTDAANWQGGIGSVLRFDTPPGTTIAAVQLDRTATGLPSGLLTIPSLGYSMAVDGQRFDSCVPGENCPGGRTGTVLKEGLSGALLTFDVGCIGLGSQLCGPAPVGGPLRLTVPRATIALRDNAFPTVENVRGTIVTPGVKSGLITAEFDSADVGGGLYRIITTIDGQVTENQPVAKDPCTDANPGDGDPYQFLDKKPCPNTGAGLSTVVDTRRLTDGDHTIGIVIEDAAGNRTTVFGPAAKITVQNAVPNGTPADRVRDGRVRMYFDVRTGRRRQRLRSYTTVVGKRVVTRGFLRTPGGKAIQGAEIEVFHFVGGKPRLLKTGLRSRKAGRLTLILPLNLFGDARGRRRIAFYYRAFRPGKVTSTQNLFLTIRTRQGGPQTKQPGN